MKNLINNIRFFFYIKAKVKELLVAMDLEELAVE